MDHCPIEIWSQIFTLACTDNGFTGRSLSLTSRYIHELSKSVKLQSLSVTKPQQIRGLARLLADTPPKYRRVRYLFIGDDEWDREEFQWEEGSAVTMDVWNSRAEECRRYETPILDAYLRILRTVAPTLTTLLVHFQSYTTCPSFPTSIPFPSLIELTLYGPRIEPPTPITGTGVVSSPSLSDHPPPFPSLRRLYLAHTYYDPAMYLRRITSVAPSLTHLSLPYQFLRGLRIRPQSHTHYPDNDSSSNSSHVVVDALPLTMKMVLVDLHCNRILSTNAVGHMRRMSDMENIAAIAKEDERLYLLKERPSGFKDAERYWWDRMEGSDGVWTVPQPDP